MMFCMRAKEKGGLRMSGKYVGSGGWGTPCARAEAGEAKEVK